MKKILFILISVSIVLSSCFLAWYLRDIVTWKSEEEYSKSEFEAHVKREKERLLKEPLPYSEVNDRAVIGIDLFQDFQRLLIDYKSYKPPRRLNGGFSGFTPFICTIDSAKKYGYSEMEDAYIVWTAYFPLPAYEGNKLLIVRNNNKWEILFCEEYKK